MPGRKSGIGTISSLCSHRLRQDERSEIEPVPLFPRQETFGGVPIHSPRERGCQAPFPRWIEGHEASRSAGKGARHRRGRSLVPESNPLRWREAISFQPPVPITDAHGLAQTKRTDSRSVLLCVLCVSVVFLLFSAVRAPERPRRARGQAQSGFVHARRPRSSTISRRK